MATKSIFPVWERLNLKVRKVRTRWRSVIMMLKKVINGKKMKDWLKFAMAWWHYVVCAEGGDQFGSGTKKFPWNGDADKVQAAKNKMDAGFEFMQKMGIEYYCFHDVDLCEEADTIENMKRI